MIADSRYSSVGYGAAQHIARAIRAAGWRTGYIDMGFGGSSVYDSGTAANSWQPSTTGGFSDAVNGQAGTTLLAKALAEFQAAGNVGYVLSPLGVNDSGGNVPTTFATKYGFIRNQVTGAGYTMLLNYPYLSTSGGETATGRIQAYQANILAMDNGTTVRALASASYDLSATGLEALSRDHLHYGDAGLEGSATARAILALIDPALSGTTIRNRGILSGGGL